MLCTDHARHVLPQDASDDFLPAVRLAFRAFYSAATEGNAALMAPLRTFDALAVAVRKVGVAYNLPASSLTANVPS